MIPENLSVHADAFWRRVRKGPACWEWSGLTNDSGYGILFCGRAARRVRAHRFSFQLLVGDITPGKCVCHRCDNRRCVRPDHLFLGTRLENTRDMDAKGRRGPSGAKGIRNSHARLTDDAVVAIRSIYDGRRGSIAALARHYGISRQSISRVVHGEGWNHVL